MSLTVFRPGDRVDYPGYGLLTMDGSEPTPRQGRVIDVIRGEAGIAQLVVSEPDDDPSGTYRIDPHIAGLDRPSVRKVGE